MAPSALWLFAHKAMSVLFHEDPARFVATLDGDAAPAFLEHQWRWALDAAGVSEPARPPLGYTIERPRPGLVIVFMQFRGVASTGEPWHVRFFVRDPDVGQANGYARMFLLEHSEYATEMEGTPRAIACESAREGKHHNWGATFAPDDEQGFDAFVADTLRSGAGPAATYTP
ncbi:MAG: hypothetical protein KF773_23000 [Deltaproteobacteria bacterium]|nr:hypothetical protein [Deltaproteobacteria bacterium]MCW5807122.1 hypothetical protein [Deltaproteobacteria bacterium]